MYMRKVLLVVILILTLAILCLAFIGIFGRFPDEWEWVGIVLAGIGMAMATPSIIQMFWGRARVETEFEVNAHDNERSLIIFLKNPPVTNRILRNAIKKIGLSIAKYQYSITQTNSRVGPIIDSFFNIFKRNIICIDISEFFHLKRVALKEFRSQIAIISSKQKKPVLSRPTIERHLKNKEVFYKE